MQIVHPHRVAAAAKPHRRNPREVPPVTAGEPATDARRGTYRRVAAAAKQSDMITPMVRAYHTIFGAYGFWLPNDPRGSWSTHVWAKHLQQFGTATKVTTSRSLANAPHDPKSRREAKRSLKYPAVRFDDTQIAAIGDGFLATVEQLSLSIFACAIMPDHVHLVIDRHNESIEFIAGFLKRSASRALSRAGCHPLAAHTKLNGRVPSPWVEGGWNVFLNEDDEIGHRIGYTNDNPVKAGLPPQQWPFVVRFVPITNYPV